MSFYIQVSNPIFLYSPSEIVSDLAEAIQVIYPMETEKAFIIWNHTYIPLSYKYNLSVIIDDILPMLSDLTSQKKVHLDFFLDQIHLMLIGIYHGVMTTYIFQQNGIT
ncbi:hypothetical protein NIES2111_62290 (plasmid) [Nostoc sp. NIES-2111]|nr:hypothetical protein NIES2111_62290 [Nostoc sp. NIES-2111]